MLHMFTESMPINGCCRLIVLHNEGQKATVLGLNNLCFMYVPSSKCVIMFWQILASDRCQSSYGSVILYVCKPLNITESVEHFYPSTDCFVA